MNEVSRLVMLNQMAGPLFRQLAYELASFYPCGVLLVTGHPDALSMAGSLGEKLEIVAASKYDKRTYFLRLFSWLCYLKNVSGLILFPRKGDALLLVSNPPILGAWVCLLSCLSSAPYCLLVYDIYPDTIEKIGLIKAGGLASKTWRAMNSLVFSRARVVITIGKRMAKRLEEQSHGDAVIAVVPLWVDVDAIRPIERCKNPYSKKFINPEEVVVLYSGNMGLSHDIESILAAAEILQFMRNICFLFIGDGERRYAVEAYIERFPKGNVRIFPLQPEALLPYTLSLADISLVALDEGMEDLMLPSKVFSYMAAGSAILAITNNNSDLAEVVENSGCGICVAPRKPELIASALLEMTSNLELLTKFKYQARRFAEASYSHKIGLPSFVDILKQAGLGPITEKGN